MEDDEKAEVADYKRKLRAEVSFWNVMIYVFLVVSGLLVICNIFYGSGASVSTLRGALAIIVLCVYWLFKFLYKCFTRFMGADWED
jgi:hypothetical protein